MHSEHLNHSALDGRDSAAGLALMSDLIGSLVSEDPAEKTVSMICRRICELAGFRFCGVLVPDTGPGSYRLAGGHGFPPEYIESLHELFLVVDDSVHMSSPTRQAADERRTIVNADVLVVSEEVPWRAFALRFGYRSMVSVPLFIDGQVIGVLNGYSSGRRTYTATELGVIEMLASQAAVSLRISWLLENRQETIRRLEENNEALKRQRISLERGHEIHRHLTNAAVAGVDTVSVAQTLADLIRRPVAVLREDGSVRAITRDDGPSDGRRRLLQALPSKGDSIDEGRLLAAGIRIPGELIGHVVVLHGNSTGQDLDRRAVEHAATILALEAVKQRMTQATEARLRTDFLTDLLRGRISQAEESTEAARRHGLIPGTRYRVLLAKLSSPTAAGTENGDLPAQASVRRELSRTSGILVVGGGTTITALVPVDDEGRIAGKNASEWAQALVSTLADKGAQSIQALGVGAPTDTLAQIPSSHADAEASLAFVERLGGKRTALVRDDLGILSLFIDTKRPEVLLSNADQTLGPAITHDRKKSGSLVATLTAYLDCGCDAELTAEKLFIHANTVRYRIRQIEALCALNLRDPEHLLQTRIATLALVLLGSK